MSARRAAAAVLTVAALGGGGLAAAVWAEERADNPSASTRPRTEADIQADAAAAGRDPERLAPLALGGGLLVAAGALLVILVAPARRNRAVTEHQTAGRTAEAWTGTVQDQEFPGPPVSAALRPCEDVPAVSAMALLGLGAGAGVSAWVRLPRRRRQEVTANHPVAPAESPMT